MTLIAPHGKSRQLKPLLISGQQRADALARAATLLKVPMTSMETCDCIMLGIGAFTPLEGFMTLSDWQSVCDGMSTADGTFWPIPITLSVAEDLAAAIAEGAEVALVNPENDGEIIATMTVTEKYAIDKKHQCRQVFRTDDENHPGVAKVLSQGGVNLAGPVTVLSESVFPETFKSVYIRPAESRALFEQFGWSTVAAFQTRNPMHRSHEYLVKIALEVSDGVFIHQIVGKLKDGDIPAEVRVEAIDALVRQYFVKGTIAVGGYPMEMRYGGPREALLHGIFRQNFGCSHLIVGRDHAGVGKYYGPFDAQKIFDEIPSDALLLRPLKIDWTFWCFKCDGMASTRTCPHTPADRLLLSGTALRDALAKGKDVPPQFSRPEVLAVLKKYYAG